MWDRIVGDFESCVSLCIFKWKYSWLDWYWQNMKLSFIFLVGCWGFTSAIYINGAFHQLLWFTFSGLAGAFMRRIEIANSLLKSFVPLLSTLYTIVARHWNLVIKNLKKRFWRWISKKAYRTHTHRFMFTASTHLFYFEKMKS